MTHRLSWRLLDAQSAPDHQTWLDAWTSSPHQLPFAHPEVAALALPEGCTLHAALLRSQTGGPGTVLYPFVLRPIADRDHYDIMVPPYAYGGPLHWGFDDDEIAEAADAFWGEFEAWATRTGVVSEFIKFSLFDDVLPYPGHIEVRKVNYVADLPSDSEAMWAGMVAKVRRNVRKAERGGVTTVVDENGEMLEEFHRIYTGTMLRHGSDEFLRFDMDYVQSLHRALPGRVVCVFGLIDGEPVSVDLMLQGRDTGYYFLGGTDAEFFGLRPNELVKTAVMDWLRTHGYRYYVLGGGVDPEDGLERYKKGFAPEGARMFCTGERILDQTVYDELVAARRAEFAAAGLVWDPTSKFFPQYRQPFPDVLPEDAGVTTPAVLADAQAVGS